MARPVPPGELDTAFLEVVSTKGPGMLRLAYLLTGSTTDAQDVLQNALLRCYLARHRVHEPAAMAGYVRTAVTREAIRHRARPVARFEVPSPTLPDTAAATPRGTAPDMWERLGALPPRQRAVLVLRYYEHLSESEIADALGCSRGTVKSQASKGLGKLRAAMSLEEAHQT